MQEKKFEQWCLVEIMGHVRLAGMCTEQVIAGQCMLRVDVPATATEQAFTRFYAPSAIYALHPIDETTAKGMAEQFSAKPINVWDLQQIINKQPMKLVPGTDDDDYEDDDPH